MTGTSVRAVSEQAEQVPAQSGLFAFQIRILRGVAIDKSGKTSVLHRFDGYRIKTFSFKWPSINLGIA